MLNFNYVTYKLSKYALHFNAFLSPENKIAALFFLVSINKTKDCLSLAKRHYLNFGDKPISVS